MWTGQKRCTGPHSDRSWSPTSPTWERWRSQAQSLQSAVCVSMRTLIRTGWLFVFWVLSALAGGAPVGQTPLNETWRTTPHFNHPLYPLRSRGLRSQTVVWFTPLIISDKQQQPVALHQEYFPGDDKPTSASHDLTAREAWRLRLTKSFNVCWSAHITRQMLWLKGTSVICSAAESAGHVTRRAHLKPWRHIFVTCDCGHLRHEQPACSYTCSMFLFRTDLWDQVQHISEGASAKCEEFFLLDRKFHVF